MIKNMFVTEMMTMPFPLHLLPPTYSALLSHSQALLSEFT